MPLSPFHAPIPFLCLADMARASSCQLKAGNAEEWQGRSGAFGAGEGGRGVAKGRDHKVEA
eukprot:214384-Chlamydomonas_euryale.AAC.1